MNTTAMLFLTLQMAVGQVGPIPLDGEAGVTQVSHQCVAPAPACALPAADCMSPPLACAAPLLDCGPACGPCNGCNVCANGCCNGCDGCDGCCAFGLRGCCGKLDSTCDMYPHYAYYPENHGYYYFRPYCHTHVFDQRGLAMMWGIDQRMPYSVAIFDDIYTQFIGRNPDAAAAVKSVAVVRPRSRDLPKLEDLLSGR